jgi:hypothetical protein
MDDIKVFAFYLPQYHPIPENDEWWGKGFTEWSNVAKAKPLFRGHLQPFLPSDLGYYDLRVPEIRMKQAHLAKDAGINVFCYWHYWFGNGKRLLERPFNEVLESGKPDFPFCLAWANESWTGKWHGLDNKVLISQTYPGSSDIENHFYSLVPAFSDKRYFKEEGKNIFLIYATINLPEPQVFIEKWRYLAAKNGLPDFFFIGVRNNEIPVAGEYDGWINNQPTISGRVSHPNLLERALYKATSIDTERFLRYGTFRGPMIYPYKEYVRETHNLPLEVKEFPNVLPNWDNTPRSKRKGLVLHGSTPELYGELLAKAIKLVIKAWNEWAEGNTLEPSDIFQDQYLRVTKKVLSDAKSLENK